jgi:hypothetical protein
MRRSFGLSSKGGILTSLEELFPFDGPGRILLTTRATGTKYSPTFGVGSTKLRALLSAACIRDNDRSLQQIVDVMSEMDLCRDTVVVFTEVLERR